METALTVIETKLKHPAIVGRIADAIGKPIDCQEVRAMITGALMVIDATEGLRRCTPQSIADCLIQCATVGLPVDNRKLMHLIPYGGVCTAMPDYTGYVYKMKQADPTLDIHYSVVRVGDKFTVKKEGGHVTYIHEIADPLDCSDKTVTGAYCFTKSKTGSDITVMNKADLETVRGCSAMKSGGIWNKWPCEMYLKSVIRRHCKVKFKEAIAALDILDNQFFSLPKAEAKEISIDVPAPMPQLPTMAVNATQAQETPVEAVMVATESTEQAVPSEFGGDMPPEIPTESGLPCVIGIVEEFAARNKAIPAKITVSGKQLQSYEKNIIENMQSLVGENVKATYEEVQSKNGKYTNLVLKDIVPCAK
jgi:recombinational DNA repair protein RecT